MTKQEIEQAKVKAKELIDLYTYPPTSLLKGKHNLTPVWFTKDAAKLFSLLCVDQILKLQLFFKELPSDALKEDIKKERIIYEYVRKLITNLK